MLYQTWNASLTLVSQFCFLWSFLISLVIFMWFFPYTWILLMPFTSVHYIVDMELLPILVFTFFTWKSGTAIHLYKQTTTRFMLSFNCSDQHVSSLLHCAALSRESLDVTFFFNWQNNHCLWNCKFVYDLDHTITELVRYGMNVSITVIFFEFICFSMLLVFLKRFYR